MNKSDGRVIFGLIGLLVLLTFGCCRILDSWVGIQFSAGPKSDKRIHHAVENPETLALVLRHSNSSLVGCIWRQCLPLNPYGAYAMYIALQRHKPKAVEALLKIGIKPNEKIDWGIDESISAIGLDGQSIFYERSVVSLTPPWYRIFKVHNEGKYPLLMAQDAESARLLLDAGADPNARDENGDTALMGVGVCKEDVVQLLVSRGADVNATNQEGETALMKAISDSCYGDYNSRYRTAEMLFDFGANIYLRTKKGDTALSFLKKTDPVEWNMNHLMISIMLRNPDQYHALRKEVQDKLEMFRDRPAQQLEFLMGQERGNRYWNGDPSDNSHFKYLMYAEKLEDFKKSHPTQ